MSHFESNKHINQIKRGEECSYVNHFTPLEIENIKKALAIPLVKQEVRTKPGQGNQLYIEGWRVFDKANEIFGFDGWRSSIKLEQLYVDEQSKRFDVAYQCTARVTLKNGAYHEDVGYGCSENFPSKGQAISKASKEASTDAVKRALRKFGAALGNCLHDKDFKNELSRPTPITQQPNPEKNTDKPLSKIFTPMLNFPIKSVPTIQSVKTEPFDPSIPTNTPQSLERSIGTIYSSSLLDKTTSSALDTAYAKCSTDVNYGYKCSPMEAYQHNQQLNPRTSIPNPHTAETTDGSNSNWLDVDGNKFTFGQPRGRLVQTDMRSVQNPSISNSFLPSSSRATNLPTDEPEKNTKNASNFNATVSNPHYLGRQTTSIMMPPLVPTPVAFSNPLQPHAPQRNNVSTAQYEQTYRDEIISTPKRFQNDRSK